jgi:ubiquinone/menaquinone biosynthesis C-methylase UbiE
MVDDQAIAERQKYIELYASSTAKSYSKLCNHGNRSLGILKDWKPKSVVDIGCGTNEFIKETLWKCFPHLHDKMVGVDFACPLADLNACATALPFTDKQYDVLTAFDMLEHLLPAQVELVLAEFARVSHRFIFSISYVPSNTKWKGENLHPTVRVEEWWINQIMRAGGGSIQKSGRYITGTWTPAFKISKDAKVILVGNGPSILNANGPLIDSFDEVVRFNTYHVEEKFVKNTGTRTTLWSTFGKGQLPGCEQRPDRVLYIHGENGSPTYEPKELYRIPGWQYALTRAMLQQRSLWLSGFRRDVHPLLATSGLQVATWFLLVLGLEQITLVGFDHFSKKVTGKHHYWLNASSTLPKEHDGEAEASIFADLVAAGRVRYLDPTQPIPTKRPPPAPLLPAPGEVVHSPESALHSPTPRQCVIPHRGRRSPTRRGRLTGERL